MAFKMINQQLANETAIRRMIPPPEMNFVGDGDFIEVGEHYLEHFKKCGLKPDHRVLDIGCGLGRMAIPMTQYLSQAGRYDGFDIREDGIQWCQEKITPSYPTFQFKHAPLRNSLYLPEEKADPAAFTFPYGSGLFDFVIATSLFTHLEQAVVCHYLDEVNRVLKRGGRMVATFFLFSHDSKPHDARLEQGLNFPHPAGLARLQVKDNPDAAIAYQESWVTAQCEQRGLQLHWPIHYDFQDIILVQKKRNLTWRQRWRQFRRRYQNALGQKERG